MSSVHAPTGTFVPGVPTRAQRLRSGLFAFLFAPAALMILGLAVTDIQSEAAVGQPLASSEGLVGLLLATMLLALISLNSEESTVGMVVACVWAGVIGTLQLAGVVRAPSALLSAVTGADASAALRWSLYPVSVLAILVGATLAVRATRQRGAAIHVRLGRSAAEAHDEEQLLEEFTDAFASGRTHYRERTIVMVSSVALTLVAMAAILHIAPDDTIQVPALGLTGLVQGYTYQPLIALVAALCLGLVAWGSRWSVLGPQVVAWVLLVFPSYFVVPVWASLTGNVAAPGASRMTAVSLSGPVFTALGMVLSATTISAQWTRRYVRSEIRIALDLPHTP